MSRRTNGLILFSLFLLITGLAYVAGFALRGFVRSTDPYQGGTKGKDIQVKIPGNIQDRTLAVFNFRSSGDQDSRLYAAGFARALADRLYCAPTSVTQQMNTGEISGMLSRLKQDPRKPVSDEMALKAGKLMAIRYVVTGDFRLTGSSADITAYVTGASGKSVIKASGSVSTLPALQVEVAQKVLDAIKVKPAANQIQALSKPNFSYSETLKTYGRSFYIEDIEKCKEYRWQMVNVDPNSSFAVIRLLEYYYHGPSRGMEVRKDKQLQTLLADVSRRFPDNSQIEVLRGLLSVKQFEYQRAEDILRRAVEKDPLMPRAHSALAYVGCCREDARLFLEESLKLAGMWPDNAYFHAQLANSYDLSASNARRGHYHSSMTRNQKREWKHCSIRRYQEAQTAVKMDPGLEEGWMQLLGVSLQLSRDKDRDLAFNRLMQISPKNANAYGDYATCFLPQWGGKEKDLEAIYAKAEGAFGKDSPEVCALMSSTIMCHPKESCDYNEALRLAELGLSKSKEPNYQCMLLKCRALFGLKRWEDSLKVAEEGLAATGAHVWRYQVGRCCALLYQSKRDVKYLNRAESMFRVYSQEIPYNTNGLIQWGWCLSHQGHPEEAKKRFLRALELDPMNEGAKEKLQYVQ